MKTNDCGYEIEEQYAFSGAFDLQWKNGLKPTIFWTISQSAFLISSGKQSKSLYPATT